MRDTVRRSTAGAGAPGAGSARRVFAVAGLAYREAWRRKVVLAAAVMTVAFLGLYWLGLHYAAKDIMRDDFGGGALPAELMRTAIAGQLLYMGLFPSSLIVGLVALFSGAGAISAELDSGVLYAVVTRPLRRWELVLGKALGLGSMVATFTVLVTGAVAGLARWQIHAQLRDLPQALALLALEPLILLCVAVLGSTRLPTVANGVLCVALYGVAWVGGLIEQIGALVKNAAMQDIGIVTSVLMPPDAIHRKAATVLSPAMLLEADGPGGLVRGATPSVWMVAYAIGFCAVALLVAMRAFARRDL